MGVGENCRVTLCRQ